MSLKVSSAKWRPFCFSLNEFNTNQCPRFPYHPDRTRVIEWHSWPVLYPCSWDNTQRIHGFPWWRHPMETFSAFLAICAGEFTGHRWIHKGQWRGALVYSLICVQIKGWETIVRLVIWDAIAPIMTSFDLRRHFAHYEVIVMHWHRVSGRQWGIMACMMCTYSRSATKPHSTVSTSPFCDDVILSTETQSELLTDTGNCKSVPNFGLASQTNTHAEFWCYFVVNPSELLNKQSSYWWFDTSLWPLWVTII